MVLPTETDNPWIWLCGMMLVGLCYIFKQWNDNRNAQITTLTAERDKERERNDTLLDSIPAIVTALAELKNAVTNSAKQ